MGADPAMGAEEGDDLGDESYIEVEQVVVTEVTTETWSEIDTAQLQLTGRDAIPEEDSSPVDVADGFTDLPLTENGASGGAGGGGGEAGDDGQKRERWGNRVEFLLSCIAMSVGLGNVWRFPFTAYENGGGAFLIPYIIVLLSIGKPLYYMELAMGQFSSHGSVRVWSVVPAFRGVGYGQMIATSAVVSYYVALMALTVFYFFASFSSVLPWMVCDPSWADLTRCVDPTTNLSQLTSNDTMGSTEMYFQFNVLKEVPNIDNGIGAPDWRLTLCLLLSWVILFLTLVKGVQSSGKVAYFTAIFPYVVLFTLLIRGVTLPGAYDGIIFYLKPTWSELLNPKVWYAAVTQSFFSLSVGFGSLIMYSSYNDFEDPVARDAAIISVADMLTSLLAGFVIFGILGNLAHELDTTVDQVIKGGGTSLAFVSYPQALANFPGVPQLFAVLFFLMLFTLGVGSATALTGCVITIIREDFPRIQQWQAAGIVSVLGFLLGLIYVTPGGQFILNLVDHFGGGFIIFILATLEVVAIQWVYGIKNFSDDLEFMIGTRPNYYWKFCWAVFIPLALMAIFIYAVVTMKPLTYGKIGYPNSAMICGWVLITVALLTVPVCFVYEVYNAKGRTLLERVRSTFQPAADWGPAENEQRKEWLQATGRKDPLAGRESHRRPRPPLQPRRPSYRRTVSGEGRAAYRRTVSGGHTFQRTMSSTGRTYRRTVSHAPPSLEQRQQRRHTELARRHSAPRPPTDGASRDTSV
ncbi:sodium-dependent nutrient amino acid transporter 1-like isoform X1 [Amphibalanus amphitrite]|uniref:sodium-dependent nutrient amino acid transporter 1-like isoform X1 n=1 Tax=Amphibalanus amphitrite TaxID=1232801 RepID=UPI001C90208A|nr:sodium-dependent nutrient amino acid transporter 1-like isoform X1 [Amphibalanus amphitrite]